MAQSGMALHTYNLELIKNIDELKNKRKAVQVLIDREEEEKASFQKEIEKLSNRVTKINENLSEKIAILNDYDRTIAESEAAYNKILESSQVLLSMVRREAACLEQSTTQKIGTPITSADM